MRVGFNARLLAHPSLRGFNRYAVNLLVELGALGIELYLYSQESIHENHLARLGGSSYEVRLSGRLHYLRWEQQWLSSRCIADNLDIFHSPCNFGLPWFVRCPTVLTLHDAIDQVYYRRGLSASERLSCSSLKSNFLQWAARTSADHILTVSSFSKQDLVTHLGVPSDKITVTPEAADPRLTEPISAPESQPVLAKYGLRLPYFFYIGGWERRKNIPFLLTAFSMARLVEVDLVLAGSTSELDRAVITGHVRNLGLEKKVRLLSWVPDEHLSVLYKSALSFVYPSEYEGFGLQLCEAMAVGCPVIAANRTSLPEVLGDGGELFDLTHPGSLASLMIRIKTDTQFRNDLCRRSYLRGKSFTWRKTARATIRSYKRLLAERVRKPKQSKEVC